MSDFAVRVKNLPKDRTYGNNPEILKAELWNYFQDLLSERG